MGWGLALAALAGTACTGSSLSSGMTPPMSPPMPQGSGYSNGVVPQAAPQSRQTIAEAVAPIQKDAARMELATVGGFKVTLNLAKPSPMPTARATGMPAATAHASPTPKATATATPSPAPTATPTAAAKAKSSAAPIATPTGPRIDTKITIYPDGAQKAPGDYDSEQSHRVPVVRLVIDPSVDVNLYSLGAFAFTIPKVEQEEERGFSVALYETRKNHKDNMLDSQLDATSDTSGVVDANNAKDPHTLSAGHTYTVILFGDPLPATPSPYSPPQYPGAPVQYQQNPQQQPPFGQQQPGLGQQPYPPRPGVTSPAFTPPPFQTPPPIPFY